MNKRIFVFVLMMFYFDASAETSEIQADADWKEVESVCGSLGAQHQRQEASKKGYAAVQKYQDQLLKKCSSLVKAFWDNYPQDIRRDQAFDQFFHPNAEPYFISEDMTEDQVQLIADLPSKGKYKSRRLWSIVDHEARDQWIKTGNAMVTAVLNSNASLERKEAVEYKLICREFRYDIIMDGSLNKDRANEAGYWSSFEQQYWKHIRFMLENHLKKYAAVEGVSENIKSMLDVLKYFSPSVSEAYWAYFYQMVSADTALANEAGAKALHKMAAENIAAIEASKLVDYTKPLEMEFVAMDGANINLADMRGKVVLIDFWSTYCGPCIAEMPHLRALYDKYRDDGFEVIGIAANGDSDKESVQEILDDKNANWPQRLDKGSDAFVSFHSLYNITSLPTVWLLNKEGVIVDRNARGERLEPLIRNYLGLDK